MARRMVSVRLTDEEIAMAKKHGRSFSEGVRRLLSGPPSPPAPPTIAESLAAGAVVSLEDASGRYSVVPLSAPTTWPPLATVGGRVESLSYKHTRTPGGAIDRRQG